MRTILLLLIALAGLAAAEPADLERLARAIEGLPALHDGRVKPLASVARHCILSLSGRSSIPLASGGSLSASAWLVEGLIDHDGAAARNAVRLRNPEVAEALGLGERPGMRFSAGEIVKGLVAHQDQLAPLFRREHREFKPAEAQLVELSDNLATVLETISGDGLRIIPGPAARREEWLPPAAVSAPDPLQTAAIAGWNDLLKALHAGDLPAAERAVAALDRTLAPVAERGRLGGEVAYHRLDLFTASLSCYIVCLLLLGSGLFASSRWLWRLAMAALAAGILCHLGGLGLRMWIMRRPPVATLYESVLFVGAVAALLGAVVEAIRRRGDGAFIGAALATILQSVALGYADDGDTMGMLVAVLNSNFWLTIHVLTITAGYGCTLVAGLAGHIALTARAIRPTDHAAHARYDRSLLILSLIALLFTLFGTILGGIWADQSWGRFWGWDPKENGALLIVLWLLLLMHLRIASLAGPRGFALGLILGNIVVALAWFGVNLLSIGLHSYGFSNGTRWALVLVAGLELAIGGALWIWATLRQPGPEPSES